MAEATNELFRLVVILDAKRAELVQLQASVDALSASEARREAAWGERLAEAEAARNATAAERDAWKRAAVLCLGLTQQCAAGCGRRCAAAIGREPLLRRAHDT